MIKRVLLGFFATLILSNFSMVLAQDDEMDEPSEDTSVEDSLDEEPMQAEAPVPAQPIAKAAPAKKRVGEGMKKDKLSQKKARKMCLKKGLKGRALKKCVKKNTVKG